MLTIADKVQRDGFCFISSLLPNIAAQEVFAGLGTLISLHEAGPVHHLTPKAETTATPNTYSGAYGYGRFPFHTDLANWFHPPRYIGLRCILGYAEVTTPLIDGRFIVDTVGDSDLFRALVHPRRPINRRLSTMRLYDDIDGTGLLRWDARYIVPANPLANKIMPIVSETIQIAQKHLIRLCHPGDTVVIDNWRILHGRDEVPLQCVDRTLERAYLESIT
jgi:hypothetical protein